MLVPLNLTLSLLSIFECKGGMEEINLSDDVTVRGSSPALDREALAVKPRLTLAWRRKPLWDNDLRQHSKSHVTVVGMNRAFRGCPRR
jgi:hypothetical protein